MQPHELPQLMPPVQPVAPQLTSIAPAPLLIELEQVPPPRQWMLQSGVASHSIELLHEPVPMQLISQVAAELQRNGSLQEPPSIQLISHSEELWQSTVPEHAFA